eukprot:scaffold172372_cov36-Prasinocladus_malaysianus.AAC.1
MLRGDALNVVWAHCGSGYFSTTVLHRILQHLKYVSCQHSSVSVSPPLNHENLSSGRPLFEGDMCCYLLRRCVCVLYRRYLHENDLSGELPPELGGLSKLTVL